MRIPKNAFTIANRVYEDDTARRSSCVDRLVRTARNKFYLIEEPTEPGGRVVVQSLTLADVYEWFRIEPEQITRTVVT